ncbi:hypothetical protein BCD64_03585 [Nostoc sp. MBR 210]|nr:hypothetical protein BCD64_03585 [Nostoc sp. MBR 210]
MTTEKDIYALLGELSVKFATLEFGISMILETLIDNSSPAIGAILTANHQIKNKLDLIKKLIPFRFTANSEIATQISELISEVDKLREDRNRFIHGNWKINIQDNQVNDIACYDLKLKSQQKGYELNRCKEYKFTIEQLEDCSSKVGELVCQSFLLARELGATNLSIES